MCGISGFVAKRSVFTGSMLDRMNSALSHRGPDDTGMVLWSTTGFCEGLDVPAIAGLAHSRLSIIDLSKAGHQPMSNEDGRIWLVFNGEFYNFADEKINLLKMGHRFNSATDSETIIHLYEQYGIDAALQRMNSMFAFAIWDKRTETLVLARDRIGKKPLYYVLLGDGSVLFASEIKALLKTSHVDHRKIDAVALAQFWSYGYTIGERTIFSQVRRLLPGHYGVWQDGKFTTKQYWDCPFGQDVFRDRSIDDLAEELESLLLDAVRRRMVSDVPVGLFLSGGVDSSLIAALTRKISGPSLRSYTVTFKQNEFNEGPFAQGVAAHLGLENQNIMVDEDLHPYFTGIAAHFDEPFGDSSAIPTFFLSRETRKHVTVALTGDAGDELFAGYETYQEGLRLWGNRSQRRMFARPVLGMDIIWDLKRRLTPDGKRLTVWERSLGPWRRRRVLSEDMVNTLKGVNVYEDRERWYAQMRRADLLSRMQYVNIKTYLPDDILVKVDRMSMFHALECRSPFLDYRIAQFAARLPYAAKIDEQGHGKRILRHILRKYVPESLTNRPKQGFTVPWSKWCQGTFGAVLRERWRNLKCPYVRPDAAEFLFPSGKEGTSALQWNAFSMMVFWENMVKDSGVVPG